MKTNYLKKFKEWLRKRTAKEDIPVFILHYKNRPLPSPDNRITYFKSYSAAYYAIILMEDHIRQMYDPDEEHPFVIYEGIIRKGSTYYVKGRNTPGSVDYFTYGRLRHKTQFIW